MPSSPSIVGFKLAHRRKGDRGQERRASFVNSCGRCQNVEGLLHSNGRQSTRECHISIKVSIKGTHPCDLQERASVLFSSTGKVLEAGDESYSTSSGIPLEAKKKKGGLD